MLKHEYLEVVACALSSLYQFGICFWKHRSYGLPWAGKKIFFCGEVQLKASNYCTHLLIV